MHFVFFTCLAFSSLLHASAEETRCKPCKRQYDEKKSLQLKRLMEESLKPRTSPSLEELEKMCETLRALIDEGADPETLDSRGDSPLHFATYALDVPLIRFLVMEHGVNVDQQTYFGTTALHVAAQLYGKDRERSLQVIKLLVSELKADKTKIKLKKYLAVDLLGSDVLYDDEAYGLLFVAPNFSPSQNRFQKLHAKVMNF